MLPSRSTARLGIQRCLLSGRNVLSCSGLLGILPPLMSSWVAEPLESGIRGSELVVFEHLSHAGLHEDPETFNRATLDFLLRQRS